jgi:hypothetical protein
MAKPESDKIVSVENEPELPRRIFSLHQTLPQSLIHCFICHTIRVRFAEWHTSFANCPETLLKDRFLFGVLRLVAALPFCLPPTISFNS